MKCNLFLCQQCWFVGLCVILALFATSEGQAAVITSRINCNDLGSVVTLHATVDKQEVFLLENCDNGKKSTLLQIFVKDGSPGVRLVLRNVTMRAGGVTVYCSSSLLSNAALEIIDSSIVSENEAGILQCLEGMVRNASISVVRSTVVAGTRSSKPGMPCLAASIDAFGWEDVTFTALDSIISANGANNIGVLALAVSFYQMNYRLVFTNISWTIVNSDLSTKATSSMSAVASICFRNLGGRSTAMIRNASITVANSSLLSTAPFHVAVLSFYSYCSGGSTLSVLDSSITICRSVVKSEFYDNIIGKSTLLSGMIQLVSLQYHPLDGFVPGAITGSAVRWVLIDSIVSTNKKCLTIPPVGPDDAVGALSRPSLLNNVALVCPQGIGYSDNCPTNMVSPHGFNVSINGKVESSEVLETVFPRMTFSTVKLNATEECSIFFSSQNNVKVHSHTVSVSGSSASSTSSLAVTHLSRFPSSTTTGTPTATNSRSKSLSAKKEKAHHGRVLLLFDVIVGSDAAGSAVATSSQVGGGVSGATGVPTAASASVKLAVMSAVRECSNFDGANGDFVQHPLPGPSLFQIDIAGPAVVTCVLFVVCPSLAIVALHYANRQWYASGHVCAVLIGYFSPNVVQAAAMLLTHRFSEEQQEDATAARTVGAAMVMCCCAILVVIARVSFFVSHPNEEAN